MKQQNSVLVVSVKILGIKNAALLAADLLAKGKIISVPTETSYGLAADATNKKAVRKIYTIKNRDDAKRIPVMMRDFAQLRKYTQITQAQKTWIKKYENKVVSFRLAKKQGRLTELGDDPTVVERKATHAFLKLLAKNFDKPFTITSTNISGQPSIFSFKEYREQFKHHGHQVDAFFDYGTLKPQPASTILDLTQNPPLVLRQGKTKINVKKTVSSKSRQKTN